MPVDIEKEFNKIPKEDLIKIFEFACKSFSIEPDRLDMILINEVFSSRKIIENEIIYYRKNLDFKFCIENKDQKTLFYVEYNPRINNNEERADIFKRLVEGCFK